MSQTPFPEMQHAHTNALAASSSPYLLEHAHNPVDWHPWGPEALRKAVAENKPLIVSIGYSACHWCHVMERESYSDTEVAAYMNAHFVSIKVDREERPDIDQIYMHASQLMTGSGGWPLNAIALPDGRPFYVVTYLPREGWMQLLAQVVEVYRDKPAAIREQAEALTAALRDTRLPGQAPGSETGKWKTVYRGLFDDMASTIDFSYGGLGRAPKFPMPDTWELLLQHHHITGHARSLEAVTVTLDHMAAGGIYDHLGGGFARYATDAYWRIPHFEKMLYDNGQLVSLYAHACQVTGKARYSQVVRQTLEFIAREMTAEDGGFYSSVNADSEGEEGKFYVWTAPEVDRVLDPGTAALLKAYYQVTVQGNWEEGKNILFAGQTDEAFATGHGLSVEKLHRVLESGRRILFEARAARPRPSTDHKILVSWNALMLKGYVDAFRALGEASYLEAALRNAHFLKATMVTPEGGLLRNYMRGEAVIPALLDDYALFADALMALYEVTFDIGWLRLARSLTDYAIRWFLDAESGLFFYTPGNGEELIARKKETEDGVMPSSNSVMAGVLYRLGVYLDQDDYRRISGDMVARMTDVIPTAVPYFARWGQCLGMMQEGPYEVAVAGEDAVAKAARIQRQYLPCALFMGGGQENLPLLKNKLTAGQTTIYVCRDKVCLAPVTDPAAALALMSRSDDQRTGS
jgi:uncharacterized protein YyaL (SSP411 family)